MNHSIRNSLILAVTLLLIVGLGWLIVHMTYSSAIEELEVQVETTSSELQELLDIAELYEEAITEHARQVHVRENFPKQLFENHSQARLYDYLIELNEGISFTDLNYTVGDSVIHDGYGIINITINGEGLYRNLYNFIHRIEHSSAIVHIRTLRLNNFDDLERLSRVNFTMDLQAYYNRGDQLDYSGTMVLADPFGNIRHNPFYPLVRPIPSLEGDLVDVDNSRLLAITARFVLLEDQRGSTRRLTVGDEVYLGSLRQIDTGNRRAVFVLDRGGFSDRVILSMD
ncbi:hypothetical protein QLX67_08770 [Balneolaceae bacterium ANBcel3]|nr:hypothetical protein [Balneolaceae bacterium ANBcel3]